MRYRVEDTSPNNLKYSVVDTWWLDPEKKANINVFVVCECHDVDAAEKIAKALNIFEGDIEP